MEGQKNPQAWCLVVVAAVVVLAVVAYFIESLVILVCALRRYRTRREPRRPWDSFV